MFDDARDLARSASQRNDMLGELDQRGRDRRTGPVMSGRGRQLAIVGVILGGLVALLLLLAIVRGR